MNQEAVSIYIDVLEEVMYLESQKKEVSSQILLTKDESKKLRLIQYFLSYDLNKHELFERAAVIAIQNKEVRVVSQIQRMYSHCEDGELLEKIRKEIKYIKSYMQKIDKGLKYPHFNTFLERRMIQEISKYVIEQARIYTGSGR